MSDNSVHVLLVDHDVGLQERLREFFHQRGVQLTVMESASLLATRLSHERPSIVVIELTMPGIDGLTALRQLRANDNMIPVIMVAARAEHADRVVGLELGADDYIEKPFLPEELLARIRAVLRRQSRVQPQVERQAICTFGRFELNFSLRTLSRDGEIVHLSPAEYALLSIFASNPFVPLSRSRLLDSLHGTNSDVHERSIDVPVWRIRQMIEDDPSEPRWLQTVRGVGYVFVPGSPDDDGHDANVQVSQSLPPAIGASSN
jgi:two-component system, OmpR family, phosphate regulon response regulator OmpR